jgi:hypothetical protein
MKNTLIKRNLHGGSCCMTRAYGVRHRALQVFFLVVLLCQVSRSTCEMLHKAASTTVSGATMMSRTLLVGT